MLLLTIKLIDLYYFRTNSERRYCMTEELLNKESLEPEDRKNIGSIKDIENAIEMAILEASKIDADKFNPDQINSDIYKVVIGEYITRTFNIGDLEVTIRDQKSSDASSISNYVANNLQGVDEDFVRNFVTKTTCSLALVSITRNGIPVVEFTPYPPFSLNESQVKEDRELYRDTKLKAINERQSYMDKLHYSFIKRIIVESIKLNKYIQAIIDPDVVSNF